MNRPIRVMQVVGRMMGGGVEATVMNYYRHIDKKRIQFDFVVQSDSLKIPKEEIESLGGRIFFVPSYNNPIAYMHACSQIFKSTHPLIVHSHMNAISVFTLSVAKNAGVPIRIAHSHSTSDPKEFKKSLVKNVLRPLSRIYPTDLAACSKYAACWLFGDKAVSEKRVRIIKNAIDLHVFHYDSTERYFLRNIIGANENTIVVGQVGRLCFQKNQQLTLRAFSELLSMEPNSILVFIGTGDNEKQLRKLVDELHVSQAVRFLGIRDDVSSWYSAFDVLAFPSKYEGLGMSAIEAQAECLPVVVSDKVADEALIEKQLCYMVPLEANPRIWAKAILEAANKSLISREYPDIMQTLQIAGYDITQSVFALQKWYESLVKNI